ncbi:MAG: hypothetical protein N2Z67_11850 [Acetobacteraceae bacterium]|nr:hypothetical protein [Acetobacteraceae bacterium]
MPSARRERCPISAIFGRSLGASLLWKGPRVLHGSTALERRQRHEGGKMRLAVTFCAMAALLMVPAADAAAQNARTERPAAQQAAAQRPGSPMQQAAQRQGSPVRTGAATQQGAAPRTAVAASRPAAKASEQRAANTAARTGLVRSAAAAPAGMPRATGTCTRRDAQGRCVGTTAANTRWQGGLPPMTMAQQECPAGTVATLARGHADVVRCLPI